MCVVFNEATIEIAIFRNSCILPIKYDNGKLFWWMILRLGGMVWFIHAILWVKSRHNTNAARGKTNIKYHKLVSC